MEIQGYSQQELVEMWENGIAVSKYPTWQCVGKRIVYAIGTEYTLVKPTTEAGVNYIKQQHPDARLVRRN
jgi:hypothetical protein